MYMYNNNNEHFTLETESYILIPDPPQAPRRRRWPIAVPIKLKI